MEWEQYIATEEDVANNACFAHSGKYGIKGLETFEDCDDLLCKENCPFSL